MQSLRRLNIIIFFIVPLLLAGLVFTGVRQNILSNDYGKLIKESEGVIFTYATVYDQATEWLLSRDRTQLVSIVKEFEQLQGRFLAMADNKMIDPPYKLAFMRDIDLGNIIILLRTIVEKPDNEEQVLNVVRRLRYIDNHLIQFDRVVVNEVRNNIIEYQRTELIIMGIIIFLTCSGLIIMYYRTVNPLIDLSVSIEKAVMEKNYINMNKTIKCYSEINTIIVSVNHLIRINRDGVHESLRSTKKEEGLYAFVNDITNRINGIINYAQLVADNISIYAISKNEKELLDKIIKNGEQCSIIIKKWLE